MNDIGQLIISGINGTTLTEDEREFLEEENIGGVILFSHNYEAPAQLAELVNNIQKCRKEYPLFICVDQEGGRVQRFKSNFTVFPSPADIALLNSPKIFFHITRIMAEELAACGVNVNFSPVCDVLLNEENRVIGDRAYGNDPDIVTKYISSVIRGLQTNNVLACAKHFPGHGGTTKDSHFELPLVKTPLGEIKRIELPPFLKAAKSRVEFIMMAHLQVDSIDESLPTSLSKRAYSLLREELRYTKIIITDDMEMKAITDRYSVEDAAVMAISAGADVIEYKTMEYAKKALEGLKEARKIKKIKNEVFNDRIQRVTETKIANLKEYNPIYIPDIHKKVNTGQSKVFMKEILEKIAEIKNT